jgi:hypothetical protein
MSPQIQIDDAAIITEVAALGGYVPISRSGKWALVAQRLGLKAARAADVQKRYEMMLNDMPDDDDDEDDAGYGRRGLDESEEDLGNLPVLDGEEIVERIIGERVKSGFKQYMVKWANTDETTWEPAANLANCIDILDEWKRSEANKKARELAGPSRKRDVPEPEPVDERQRKRGASAQHVAQIEKDVVLCAHAALAARAPLSAPRRAGIVSRATQPGA